VRASRTELILSVICLGIALATLTGCGFSPSANEFQTTVALHGTVHGGQQPVNGSLLQLYAAGTGGSGSAAHPLLRTPVQSDSHGNFSIPASYLCPSASSQLFVVARGGRPALSSGADNPQIALMAVLGSCDSLSASAPISVNEVTTVGSVWPLASYMTSRTNLGSAPGDTDFLAAGSSVNQFINLAQGSSPGISTPDSYFAENSKLYSLANVLDKCVNSSGGSAGDGSPCGVLLSIATPSGATAPNDTLSAAMNIAQDPDNNVAAIYDLATAPSAFQPTLFAAPPDWTLSLSHPVATPSISLASGTYQGSQEVTISDSTGGSKIYYTKDGMVPTTSSPLYSGAFSIGVTSTVQAIAVLGVSQSTVASSTLTITPPASPAKLAFLQQPTNALAQAVITPAVIVAVEDSNSNVVSSVTSPIQLSLSGSSAALGGTISVTPQKGIATFNDLSVSTPGGAYTLTASSTGLNSATSTKFTISPPVGVTSAPVSGATYYLAPVAAGGNDSNSGTSATTPWLTPNHPGLKCGDKITAAAGRYAAMTITTTPDCQIHNAVFVTCAVFDACKINQAVYSQGGIDVQASYWAFLGWEVTAISGPWASCFAAIPGNGATSSIHDIYFINDIANGCMAGGIVSAPTGKAGVDYFVAIADIAYNAAQGNAYCYSGVSVFQPVATDTNPGTHIYAAQIFSWNNLEPPICANVQSTDGEGIIFDTFNGLQGGLSPYAQQSVIENVIAVYNGAFGVLAGGGSGNSSSPMFVRNVTAYGNFITTSQNQGLCAQMASFGYPTTNARYANRYTTFTNNLAVSQASQLPGCGTHTPYAYYFGNIDGTDAFYGNAGYSVSGQFIGYAGLTVGFQAGANYTGTDPALANPVEPPAPSCSGKASVIDCMSTVIANFKPTNAAYTSYGYQPPSQSPVVNPLFPQWLCANPNMPTGLVSMGCSSH
jgi:Chitobiase/beta-hexosaminidase C-terminal domain